MFTIALYTLKEEFIDDLLGIYQPILLDNDNKWMLGLIHCVNFYMNKLHHAQDVFNPCQGLCVCISVYTFGKMCIYRKGANFRGHNISWVKFWRRLIFVGKSSPP